MEGRLPTFIPLPIGSSGTEWEEWNILAEVRHFVCKGVGVWVSFHIRSLEKYDKRKRIFEESALSHFWRHGRRGASQGHLALCFLTEGGGHGRGRRVPWNERGENGGIRLQ